MLRLVTLLLLLPLTALAEVTTLPLSHRNAESLIPLLRPVVDEGIRLSGRGELLIVNASPEQLEELRQLVSQIDTPLQSLLISVLQGDESTRSGLHGEVSGNLSQPRVLIYGTDKRAAGRVS